MKKQTLVLLIVIVVLLITMLLGYFFRASQVAARKESTSITKSKGIKIDLQDVKKITINNIVLQYATSDTSTDGSWNYYDKDKKLTLPVSDERLTQFIDAINNFKKGRVVETTPKDIAKYGLVDDAQSSAHTVEILSKSGDILWSLAMSEKNGESYAQFKDDLAVYKVDSSLTYTLSSDATYWLDKRIISDTLDKDAVQKITVSLLDGMPLVLTRTKKGKDSIWSLNDSSDMIDSQKVDSYISSIIIAKAKDFSDVEMVDSMKQGEVTLIVDDSTDYTLILYAFADTYYVAPRDNPHSYVFVIPEYLKNSLFSVAPEKFIAEEKEADDKKEK